MNELVPVAPDTADYRIVSKIKNNRILTLIEYYGYTSVSHFCRENDLSPGHVGQLINQKIIPFGKKGAWLKTATDMADALKVSPDMLFSDYQQHFALETNTAERYFCEDLLLESDNNPETLYIESDYDMNTELQKQMETLKDREREVLYMRFGMGDYDEHTLEETGAKLMNVNTGKLGVDRERVRQIEANALRKLRHPTRSKDLREFLDFDQPPKKRQEKPQQTFRTYYEKTKQPEDHYERSVRPKYEGPALSDEELIIQRNALAKMLRYSTMTAKEWQDEQT